MHADALLTSPSEEISTTHQGRCGTHYYQYIPDVVPISARHHYVDLFEAK